MDLETQFPNTVFRYRSIDALLGERKELERRTIYFAPPELLNDPMEGFRQIYWKGDRITWGNLLRHYIICLYHRVLEALLSDDDKPLKHNSVAVFADLENLPTDAFKLRCKKCISKIEKGKLHKRLLKMLSSLDRNVGESELGNYLGMVHIHWFAVVYNFIIEDGPTNGSKFKVPVPVRLPDVFNELERLTPQILEQQKDTTLEIISEIHQSMNEQMNLITAYNNNDDPKPKKDSLLFDFPSHYLKNLAKLIYPDWYVACFSKRPDNASMWSYYANNHDGCCLVFDIQNTNSRTTIQLNGPSGFSNRGITRRNKNYLLQEVNYHSDAQRANFFTNIGNLSTTKILNNWFKDQKGTLSPLANYLGDEEHEKWHKQYWDDFSPPLLQKLSDWEHEQEQRIILIDNLGFYSSDEGRLFTYDHKALKGIIFGKNVSFGNKLRIMRIMDDHLTGLPDVADFKFYQANYDTRKRAIKISELNLIQYSN